MQRVMALVSCVKQKQPRPAPARELYSSALFTKMRAYAERNSDAWFVLSANFGLVHPDTITEPYEQTLNTAGVQERRAWARHVHGQLALAGLLRPGTGFLWLAGRKYMADLAPMLGEHPQSDPLQGMKIGERLGWLTRALSS